MKMTINPINARIGNSYYPVHLSIEIKDGNLSICGVVGALRNGNCKGSCGQISDVLLDCIENEKDYHILNGYDKGIIFKVHEIWKRWHLNDMRAGTPVQEAFIREWSKTHQFDYTLVCEALTENGIYNDEGYKYGTKWLKEELPQDVVAFLSSLPIAKTKCAWGSY